MLKKNWENSDYLPEGWLYKFKKGNTLVGFKTENRAKFTFKEAVVHLENDDRYTQTDIDKIHCFQNGKDRRLNFQSKHTWTKSEFLPEGWLGKRVENSNKCKKNGFRMLFLEKNGFRFVGIKAVAA